MGKNRRKIRRSNASLRYRLGKRQDVLFVLRTVMIITQNGLVLFWPLRHGKNVELRIEKDSHEKAQKAQKGFLDTDLHCFFRHGFTRIYTVIFLATKTRKECRIENWIALPGWQ